MLIAVAKCLRCAAVVNTHWKACLVCQSPIEAGASHGGTEEDSPRVSHEAGSVSSVLAVSVEEPRPPLSSGWVVAYRGTDGQLRGGHDDREAGTVKGCRWDGYGWTVHLRNGDSVPLSRVVSVGQTDRTGRIVAVWLVREHGYDGLK
jgi:hypothetical protein